jgi:hypothetical protein
MFCLSIDVIFASARDTTNERCDLGQAFSN